MLLANNDDYNKQDILNELLKGSGVVVVKDVYSSEDIEITRNIINEFASNQEQKESHFNAEAEASGKIHLQQRVWNLFGKGAIFGKLISHDVIFDLMSSFLGTEFTCGSYCASRLMPGAPGQELHVNSVPKKEDIKSNITSCEINFPKIAPFPKRFHTLCCK